MSYGSALSIIPVTLLLAVLIMVLPVSAANTTAENTTAAINQTTVAPTQTEVATNQTTIPVTETTVATNQTPAAPTQTTAPPAATTVTTPPTTAVTTAVPATSGTVTATTGSVNVYSSPAGASILIDGVYCGVTPRTVADVPAGNHILRLTLSGYNDYEGSIYVIAGQTAQGYGTLQPIIRVTPAAPTATVVVPVIVPVVTATPGPTQDAGLFGNSSVVVAIIGALGVIIASAASIFTHVKPPKKE
jgi:PEGA domain